MRSVHLLWSLVFLSLITPFSSLWDQLPSLAEVAGDAQNVPQQTPPLPVNRPILRTGSQGAEVSELQAALKLLGYYTGKVDGVYTEITAIAVSKFQLSAGLNPDGIVGSDTWNRLFPGTPPSSGTASTSPRANSAASFPVPSTTETTPAKPSPQATTSSNPTASKRPATATANPRASTRQATTSDNSRTSTRQSTTRDNSRTSTRQTGGDNSRTYNRQSTTRDNSRSSIRQTGGDNSRTYNRSSTRRSTSRASSENDQSPQVNLPILRQGMEGSAVKRLQQRLRSLGFFKGTVNGVFGESTQTAVLAAQERFKLDPDGVVGPSTWSVLLR